MRKQFSSVVEWTDTNPSAIFWKFPHNEIKKGSKLILRPGQDAIFFNNGKIEGIFTESGDYDIDSKIIPFLSTLKGFKFGFNSGMRVEVLFVNTKQFEVKWGTKNPILIPTPQLPGGMPIRSNGNFFFQVTDYINLIDNFAGMADEFFVTDIQSRISSSLDQLLMKWISKEGKDMFNLQANAMEIGNGIKEDLDMQIINNGMTIRSFNIMSFNYPKEVQDMINKAASHAMVGDIDKYTQVSMADSFGKGGGSGAGTNMAEMMMGMKMAEKMMDNMDNKQAAPKKFCGECGAQVTAAKFCSNCGSKF
ncbi:MAG: SPFH domain-containing protein [bacterium]